MKNKVLGPLNIIDLLIILIFALGLLCVFIVKKGHFSASGKMIQESTPIEIDALLVEKVMTGNSEVFKAGEKTFITLRNVPYTKLDIVKAQKFQLSAKDVTAYPYVYNFLVTIRDNAAITEDGPVIGGNKIKIGMPIILEGRNYKLGGIVSDLRIGK